MLGVLFASDMLTSSLNSILNLLTFHHGTVSPERREYVRVRDAVQRRVSAPVEVLRGTPQLFPSGTNQPADRRQGALDRITLPIQVKPGPHRTRR